VQTRSVTNFFELFKGPYGTAVPVIANGDNGRKKHGSDAVYDNFAVGKNVHFTHAYTQSFYGSSGFGLGLPG